MKKVLFVINTLGGAGAEKALLELLKRFPENEYEVSLYVLLAQGELIHQVPEQVKILNQSYSDASVLSKKGKHILNQQIFKRLFVRGAIFKNLGYMLKNMAEMLKKGKLYPDKLLWRVMADSTQVIDGHYDMAVAFLEGGSTYYIHDHIRADRKVTFLHVDYSYAGYSRSLDRDCYLDFDRVFTVSDEVKKSFLEVYPECRSYTGVFHNLLDNEEIIRKSKLAGGFEDAYDGKRILTVGRLTAQKAYDIAIDAMKILKDHGVKAKWYVLGEGELRDRLQIKLFEGKSIAIQEAQILGCTLLVSDCSGNREQVIDGVDGKMCQLTPEGISAGIEELLSDEEKCREYCKKASEKLTAEKEDVLQMFRFNDN